MRKMKDSGIEWIGEIPSEWKVIKCKHLIEVKSGDAIRNELLSSNGKYQVFGGGEILGYTDVYNANESNLLIGRVGARCGCVTRPFDKVFATDNALVVIPKSNRNFLYYVLISFDLNRLNTSNAQPLITSSKVKNITIPVPLVTTQQKIADFLDKKCSEIDSVISKTSETIEEYKKLKQSIITEVVTGKVKIENGKVCGKYDTYKDSGIEWIGEIPSEWEVKPIKALFSFGKGLPITKDNLTETGLSVISYGQIHSKNNIGTEIRNELIRYVDKIYYETNPQSLVHKGDFIFADTSEDLSGCGNFVYVNREEDLFAGYHTIILFSKEKNDNKYLAYLFQTDCWRRQIRCCCSGVKLFSISRRILGATNLILPSIPEQQQISDFLDKKCSEIDSLITKKEQLVVELETYKKSLIYEVVTGKRSV